MKRLLTISIIVLLILAGGFYFLILSKNSTITKTFFDIGNYDLCVFESVNIFPEETDKIKSVCEMEKLIVEKPEEFKHYLNSAFEWKGLGEKNPTINKVFFERAIVIYTMANEKFPAKYLTSWNLAHLYKNLGDNENALKYFEMAVANNDLDPEPYLALGEFYRYNLNKDANFMINYYEKAINNAAFGREPLMDAYVKYLIDIEYFSRALPLVEDLEVKFPGQYKDILKEIEAETLGQN